jgi:uncharacterized protein YegP (UPF0339 family)
MKKRRYGVIIYQDAVGKWRWHVKHKNGRVLFAATEGYTRRCDALRPLRAFIREQTGQWWACIRAQP